MKSVLISIHPKWCDLIASGKKTIEVRKTRPKIETPFKCYIYETKARLDMPTFVDEDGHVICTGRGRVIGEFVCDGIYQNMSYDCEQSCVSVSELRKYANGKPLYGWHISDLKIYDKPRELSDFYVHKYDRRDYCDGCVHHECPVTEYPCCECLKDERNRAYLYRPPQSWVYVEELQE